ncbi:MAG: Gfo/Idh/MocA family oxidoreductase [Treponema sp.]|nr:Gfo/Idh/MocA family oxidoreductase [Treponema sp.]
MKKIKVLLAGIGGYGSNYLNEMLDAKDPPYEFSGAADPFAASSPRFAELKERGIPVFKTPDEFFASGGKADLSVIAAPIHTHYSYILSCLKNKSYVLCEKPITGSLERLDELIAREEESGLFCAVGFQYCFAPDTLALKKDIMDGLYGKPLGLKAIELPRRGDKYYSRNNWAARLVVEGETILDSPLNNACSHDLQLMLFLLGNEMNRSAEVTAVDSEVWRARPDIENYDAVAVRAGTKTGATINFYTAHCVDVPQAGPIGEFKFEKALIRWGETHRSGFKAYFNNGSVKSYEELHKENVLEKFYDCLDSVNSGKPPYCTLRTVRDHLVCVVKTQNFPIKNVQKEKLVYKSDTKDGNPFYYVPGLAEAFLKCYGENALPSELGFNW